MPLASNVTIATVTGQYVDYTGAPIAGQIKFSLTPVLRNAVADQIIIPSTITVSLDATGSFSVQLPTTDDPDLSPTGFTYQVQESFAGGRSYSLSLPVSSLTPTAPTYNALPVNYETYGSLLAANATYASVLSTNIIPAIAFDVSDYAPTATFTQYYPLAAAWDWAALVAQTNALDALIDQSTGSFLYYNPNFDQVRFGYATLNDVKSNFATFNALKAGPAYVSGTSISNYQTQAQTAATNAQNSRDAALASQAQSEAQLASIQTENASRLDDFLLAGA